MLVPFWTPFLPLSHLPRITLRNSCDSASKGREPRASEFHTFIDRVRGDGISLFAMAFATLWQFSREVKGGRKPAQVPTRLLG